MISACVSIHNVVVTAYAVRRKMYIDGRTEAFTLKTTLWPTMEAMRIIQYFFNKRIYIDIYRKRIFNNVRQKYLIIDPKAANAK